MPEFVIAISKFLYQLIPALALIVAIMAFRRARESARALEEAGGYIQQISENLTTQYIGQFPDFLPHIVDAVRQAKTTLEIACDFAGYGMYSSHEQYVHYRAALELKKTTVNITMVVLAQTERDRMDTIQFQDMTIEKLKDPTNTEFHGFLRWSGRQSSNIKTMQEFVKALSEEENRAWREHFRGLQQKEYPSVMPLHLWIVDDKVAIFSFRSLVPGIVESGFLTRDHRLITELRCVFQSYDTHATAVNP